MAPVRPAKARWSGPTIQHGDADGIAHGVSVKDIQAYLRYSRAETTANECMQALPDSVKEMVGSVYELLTKSEQAQAEGAESAAKLLQRTDAEWGHSPNLLPNATNSNGCAAVNC